MIFLGPLYQPSDEEKLLADSKISFSNAPNKFQMSLLGGIHSNGERVTVVNVLPVGVWPFGYKHLILPSKKWSFYENDCYEIGCINLPFIKQFHREKRVKKQILKLLKEDKEILIYSTYLPFLRAVRKLEKDVKVTLIVPDLPQYYDLGKTSFLRKRLRELNNKMLYRCMGRVDKFVLLTDAMKVPLLVGERPYTVVEGVCSDEQNIPLTNANSEKEIIFYSGTLHSQFGIKELLKAFHMLEKENVELWICGDGDAKFDVMSASEKDSRIKYFGFVSSQRVSELRSHATVLVNPRRDDGEYTKYSFPSKTMEYMASGIPVVMHKLSGIPKDYDEHLIYIEQNTAKAIKDAFEKVFNMSKENRLKLGQASRSFVLENKSSKVQAQKIIELMNR